MYNAIDRCTCFGILQYHLLSSSNHEAAPKLHVITEYLELISFSSYHQSCSRSRSEEIATQFIDTTAAHHRHAVNTSRFLHEKLLKLFSSACGLPFKRERNFHVNRCLLLAVSRSSVKCIHKRINMMWRLFAQLSTRNRLFTLKKCLIFSSST